MSKSNDLVYAELTKLCMYHDQPQNYKCQEIPLRSLQPRLRIILLPSHKPFVELTLFNELPRELRNLIWEFAAFQSRSVKISHYVESWTKLIGTKLFLAKQDIPGFHKLIAKHERRDCAITHNAAKLWWWQDLLSLVPG
jgi:hypothetical protein